MIQFVYLIGTVFILPAFTLTVVALMKRQWGLLPMESAGTTVSVCGWVTRKAVSH